MAEVRRSTRVRPAATAVPPEDEQVTWRSLVRYVLPVVVLLAVVVAAGLVASRALTVTPSGSLANCHPARQLGPHRYLMAPAMCIDAHRDYLAQIDTTRGRITVLLNPSRDPQSVNNFVVLATNGFYNGLTFWHAQDWYTQAGDPLGNGRGGPGYTLPSEYGGGKWVSGAVGMAREQPSGAISGSQFFILRGDWPNGGPPNGQVYNRLGTLVGGADVLGQISSGDAIRSITVRPA